MNSIFFSIIIPTYNRGAFIENTLQSILKQSYSEFEIIIVDDGSLDNTKEVIENLKDHRIKYYYKNNQERAVARNYGLKKAKGNYINYFDSDDLFLENRLQEIYDCVAQNNFPNVVYSNFLSGSTLSIKNTYTWKRLLDNNFFACGSIFIKKEIADQFKFNESPELITAEDWELWLRVMHQHTPLYLDKPTYQQIEHNNRSLNTINWNKVLKRELTLFQIVKEEFQNKSNSHSVQSFLADRFTYIAIAYFELKTGKMKIVQSLAHAIVTYPLVITKKRFWAALLKLVK